MKSYGLLLYWYKSGVCSQTREIGILSLSVFMCDRNEAVLAILILPILTNQSYVQLNALTSLLVRYFFIESEAVAATFILLI